MWNFNRKKRDTKIAIEKIHNIRKWENRPPIYVKFPLSSVIPISSNGLCFVGWCVGVLPHCCSISSQVSECPRLASFILQRWERLVVACFLCQVQLALHQHLDVSRHVRNQVRHKPGEEEHEMLSSVRHVFQSNNSNFQNSTVWILIHSYMQRFIRPCPVHSIDAAYCYRSSSKICLSLCWSQPWVLPKWLNQWICHLGGGAYSCGPTQPCVRWGSRFLTGYSIFRITCADPLDTEKYTDVRYGTRMRDWGCAPL